MSLNLRIRQFFYALMVLVIVVVNVTRFIDLDKSPPGFHVDEMGAAVTSYCLATEGVDAKGISYPVFSDLNYGSPKPPTYIYPMALWLKVFGLSRASVRALSAMFIVLSILGLFIFGRLTVGWSYGLWAAFFASISPWIWTFSRIGYESSSCVTYLIWAMVFIACGPRTLYMIAAGFFLSCAMYAYPPMRVHVPLMLPFLIWYGTKKLNLKFKHFSIFFLSLFAFSIPLIIKVLNGSLQQRFNELSIFAPEYWKTLGINHPGVWDYAYLFFNNMLKHFQPNFLFLHGDQAIVHSTQFSGEICWLGILTLIAGIIWILFKLLPCVSYPRKRVSRISEVNSSGNLDEHKTGCPTKTFGHDNTKKNPSPLFLFANIVIGIVPAALTYDGSPHALRSIGAWPFVILTLALIMYTISRDWPIMLPLGVITGMLFSFFYLKDYFQVYPKKSWGMFNTWSTEQAQAAKSEKDWLKFMIVNYGKDLNVRYYLMEREGVGCFESATIWEKINQKVITELKKKP